MKNTGFICLLMIFLSACSGSPENDIIIDRRDDSPVEINFAIADGVLEEGDPAITVDINFSKAASSDFDLILSVESNNAVLGDNYVSTPAPSGGEVVIPVESGDLGASMQIGAVVDNDMDEEVITFTIQNLSEEGVELGNNLTYRLRIVDINPIDPQFESCLLPQSTETLEIVTWNIENFPMQGSTVAQVIEIIQNMDVDVIAVQEITSSSDFRAVVNGLEGWEGELFNVRGGIDLGYLYKTSEITSIAPLEILFDDLRSPFPRQPVVTEVTHINGLTVKIVNIHLKCCNDGIERRRNASNLMKDFFDINEANTNLVVVGDWNDDLDDGAPFQDFEDDAENYQFADLNIANGPSANWSFPSFPSHIDHILISNELFDNLVGSSTIRLEGCVSNFSRNVSDHRPVMAVFSGE